MLRWKLTEELRKGCSLPRRRARAQRGEGTGVLEGRVAGRLHSKEGERRCRGGGAEEHGLLSAGGREGTCPSSRDYQLSAVGLSPPAPGTEHHGDEPCLLLESMLPPGMPGQRSLGSRLRGSGLGVRRVSAVQLLQGPGRCLLSSGLSL